jgi:hypothetical protein
VLVNVAESTRAERLKTARWAVSAKEPDCRGGEAGFLVFVTILLSPQEVEDTDRPKGASVRGMARVFAVKSKTLTDVGASGVQIFWRAGGIAVQIYGRR